MTTHDFIEELELKITGDILECELDSHNLERVVKSAIRELQRYYTEGVLINASFSPCIHLDKLVIGTKILEDGTEEKEYLTKDKISSVTAVFRDRGLAVDSDSEGGHIGMTDPMQMAQWQLLGGMGNITGFQDATQNFMAYSTTQMLRNTLSTDMFFRYDRKSNCLYINASTGNPSNVCIEYIPVINRVEDIDSIYWLDMLMLLSMALVKVTLGRIRTKFTQSNSLWQNDGATILAEGQQELQDIREKLLANSNLFYPID